MEIAIFVIGLAIVGLIGLFIMLGKENAQKFILFCREYWIQFLLFCVAIGNADVWRDYLVTTGAKDSVQLIIAIYATEMVIVSASLWGGWGVAIAAAMFLSSLVAIHSTYGDGTWFGGDWIGHSYFSITIFLGTVGEYARKKVPQLQNKKALGAVGKTVEVDENGVLDHTSIAKMSVQKIQQQFNISKLYRAQKLQKMAREGKPITMQIIEAMKQ